jgi:two-component system, chemotaxis family, chemotaxis protein CheY
MAVDLEMRILVVEDNRTMGHIVRNLLKLIGFNHIDNIFDGAAALQVLRDNEYGLVVSDWYMQPMSGQEFLEKVRADPSLKRTRFVVVSVESNPSTIATAMGAGADGYMIKPFASEALREKIAAVFDPDAAKLATCPSD